MGVNTATCTSRRKLRTLVQGDAVLRRLIISVLVFSAIGALAPSQAWAESLKFGLDWSATGAHAPYFAAAGRGSFQRRGLNVAIEPGAGAADAVRRVAAGGTDFGIADLSAIIKHNALHPQNPVTAFYIVHDRSPLSVMTLARNNIAHPRDLEGKTVGAPEGEAGRTMFPLLARAAGVDPAKVTWRTTDARLRESELVAGTVDAITGFSTAAPFLVLQGVSESEIRVLRYADFGLDHYSTAVFARTERTARETPLMRAVAAAVDEALRWSMANPEEAVEFLAGTNRRISKDVEVRRLKTTVAELMVTPTTQAHGLSHVDPGRLQKMIDDVAASLALPVRPPAEQVYRPLLNPSRLPAMNWLPPRPR
jgi:NitT/TauT family transport system substrate-binding protein